MVVVELDVDVDVVEGGGSDTDRDSSCPSFTTGWLFVDGGETKIGGWAHDVISSTIGTCLSATSSPW